MTSEFLTCIIYGVFFLLSGITAVVCIAGIIYQVKEIIRLLRQ